LNDIPIKGSHDEDERDAKDVAATIFGSKKSPEIEENPIEKGGDASNGHQQLEIAIDRCKDDDEEKDEIKICRHLFRKIHSKANDPGIDED
jgi:hypothetical protein